MTMDTDEFYLKDQLAYAKEYILQNNIDSSACKMRIFFKEATYEYYPYDDWNAVPLIYECSQSKPFRIAVPYTTLIDPTRRMENYQKFHLFERKDIEMYHMTFVRHDMRTKLENVSNRVNYVGVETFLKKFETWKPEDGILHPHMMIGTFFTEIQIIPNHFGIYLDRICKLCLSAYNTKRCSGCKKVWYCSAAHQMLDWKQGHKDVCLTQK